MALEQQKDLRPLNISPQFRAQQQQQRAPQTPPPPSPRKVKLLCSFGGKILPRPSDGALRYVGGHTRIISVPKDVPFADLMAKMAEVNGGVGPVSFKYQLPNEDLDALISVSCPEDLENMMDEYEKIAESAADGSAKIRAFMFSPSEHSSADGGVGDMSDTGQRYYEAVNGGGGSGSVGTLKRKDSGLSAGSSNSGNEAADGFSEGNVVSPRTLNSGAGSNFAGQGYLDHNQMQYLKNTAVNFAPLPVHVNAAAMAAPPAAVQVSSNRTTQPLSQLPPLPPVYQQNVEGYGLNSSPVANQGQGVRLDDCHMCQKMLPHAHSDTLVPNHLGNRSPTALNPVFYSQLSEDAMRSNNVVEPRVESQLGAYGFPQVSDAAQYEAERPFVQKMENVDHARVFLPPDSMGLPLDSQSPYGLFSGNFLQSRQQEPQMQRHQQQWQQNVVSPHYHLKPDAIVRPVGNDVGSVRNAEGSPVSNEYARPINEMMKGLNLSPNAGFSGQGNAAVMPDSSPLIVDSIYSYMPQAGGNVMLAGRPLANAGVVQERNYLRPNEQLPPTTAELNRMHNYMAVDPSQGFAMAGNQGPFPHHLGVRGEPPIPSEGLLAMPTYTSGIDPAFTDRVVNMAPIGVELREESSQLLSKDMFDHVAVPQSGNLPFGLSNATTSPTGLVETIQEPSPTESLFCNQDPRKILGGAPPLPPRPSRVGSRESIVPKDSGVQIHLGNSTESDIIAMLEEGGLNHSLDSPNKDLHQDRSPPVKGSGDEQIKQDLQAVAEDVASSVLNSPLPSAPVFFAHDEKGVNTEFKDKREISEGNTEMQRSLASPDTKIEDNKPKVGLHITDDIGRLQIIKNSDLEELRELGSGTFGTVYHGKWRGSDVAIKRINDRCFSGKLSEQERMRADFWNEACKLADLHHPNVVAFYGLVLDGPGGSVATVTEYMVNGSLRTALQRNDKTFDRRKRLLIAMDVAFGMEYLHGRNIVHFDLKSDNLLVNLRDPQRPICKGKIQKGLDTEPILRGNTRYLRREKNKVGDLGLSKVKCQTLISGGVRGTLPWMAPELLNGSSSLVSEKVDVFSFGIVMWELLTGEEPYADLHYGAIIGGIVSNTLRPPVPELCDPQWRALMERCWSADPSERPSFTDIAERLRSMAASIPQKGQAQTQVQK